MFGVHMYVHSHQTNYMFVIENQDVDLNDHYWSELNDPPPQQQQQQQQQKPAKNKQTNKQTISEFIASKIILFHLVYAWHWYLNYSRLCFIRNTTNTHTNSLLHFQLTRSLGSQDLEDILTAGDSPYRCYDAEGQGVPAVIWPWIKSF